MKSLRYNIKRKSKLSIFLILLVISISLNTTISIKAAGEEIAVVNPQNPLNPGAKDGNFIFYTNTTSVGSKFNATLWVYGYGTPPVFAWQARLFYKRAAGINITRAWNALFDPAYIFTGTASVNPPPAIAPAFNATDGTVLVGDSSLGASATPPPDPAILAIIEFQIISAPSSGKFSTNLRIDNADTLLLDDTVTEIPGITKTNGYYELNFVAPPTFPPTAFFTYYPPSPTVNEMVTFNASLSTPNGGTITSYIWNFGDSNTTTVSVPIITHPYAAFGTYNVTLTVTDSEGLNDTTWRTITVIPPRTPILEVKPSSYRATHTGEVFNISVTIGNLDSSLKVVGVQFKLRFDSALVEVLNVTEGPFMKNATWTPNGTFFISQPPEFDPLYNSSVVAIGIIILPNGTGFWNPPFPSGNGTLATITFNVTGWLPGSFILGLNETLLIDTDINEIPHFFFNGFFELFVLTATITEQPAATYERTESATMKFVVQYPNGTYFTPSQLGSMKVGVYNGTNYIANISLTAADFDPSTNNWTAKWAIPWNYPLINTTRFTIFAYQTIDRFGNWGPGKDVSSNTFEVTTATLAVSQISTDRATYKRGSWVTIFFQATYPGGSAVTTGNAIIVITRPDSSLAQILIANYAPANSRFEAQFWLTDTEQIGTWTVALAANALFDGATPPNSGPASNVETTFAAVQFKVLDIQIDVGSTYFRGEQAAFSILTTLEGQPVNPTTLTVSLYYPNGTAVASSRYTTTSIATGFYKVAFNLLSTDPTGTFTLIVQASYVTSTQESFGSALKSFLVSSTLTDWNARLTAIENGVGTIQTDIGTIKVDLADINASIVSIKVDLADVNASIVSINTSLGLIQTTLSTINTRVVSINGTIVILSTSVGQIRTTLDTVKGSVDTVKGDTATIKTTLGDVQASLGGLQSLATMGLAAASILSAIAAIVAILILLRVRKR